MQVSAEVRWFWAGRPPLGLKEWFIDSKDHGCVAGGGGTRTDYYLPERHQAELGIKRRGGGGKGIEVKGLVATAGKVARGPFSGPIELWTKWTSTSLRLTREGAVRTRKRRWLRKFDTTGARPREIALNAEELPLDSKKRPARGCNVELTKVTLSDGTVWWTLGFEAFGTLDTVPESLKTAAKVLSAREPPELGQGLLASYPAWLKRK